ESMDFVKKPQIDGRVKSIYGIYKKVYMTQRGFDEIYDKYAVRIIVSTVYECYSILGVIHDMFKPIPNRFKDYISTPKANMYQSLHTTVIGREGIPFEVQIRTWEMHHTAEYGIAAHWKYKEGIHGKDRFEGKLAWIRQIIEAQQETNDVEEIVRTIKSDLAPEDVFAFTPKGDMITLPVNSTVIDFAYAIHTQVGHKMMSAKVDGKIVSLDYKIKTGEIVEIILTKDESKGPNRSWLDIAKTNEAKAKIRSWFKKECREENIRNGKDELMREFRRNLIRVPEDDLDEFLSDDLRRHNCDTVEDFYAAIGYGGILLSRLIQRYKDKYTKQYVETEKTEEQPTLPTTPNRKKTDGITVEGMENCLIKFAKCCNPLPGDDVVGFITRGHGVSIHKADCVNYVTAMEEEKEVERWVKASWEETHTKIYRTTIDIISYDRPGLLADVANLLSEMRIFIHESVSRGLKDGYASITVTISVGGIEQLNNVVARLKRIPGVSTIERTGK
ncbi:MAG: bifunctional (p)ppGpp synthetase/guanosine-3',5'-bis(diphosphate) 3'-pyrophosphohydrolase, partial [Oscillospiraceae bacterium]|nr:bifunctional (p)ppGpp synthetase/guanosine-3',5'-bis(diphosphate) 3'-pyrophosphohydrolase [Oscillospiraceae bacterium]